MPAGVWQGARIAVGQVSDLTAFGAAGDGQVKGPTYHGWSLLGCTLAPPWDERGFELAARDELLRKWPAPAALIRALTR